MITYETCIVCLGSHKYGDRCQADLAANFAVNVGTIGHIDHGPLTPPKGQAMPRTVEHYQANAIRDQELILEQKAEISKLKVKINKLEQRK